VPMDEEFDEVHQEIVDALENCIKMGLVEIVGINDKGEWLYGATEQGKELAEFGMLAEIIDNSLEEDDIQ
jgi:hypothetical protein